MYNAQSLTSFWEFCTEAIPVIQPINVKCKSPPNPAQKGPFFSRLWRGHMDHTDRPFLLSPLNFPNPQISILKFYFNWYAAM
jgi:hypothetical protein